MRATSIILILAICIVTVSCQGLFKDVKINPDADLNIYNYLKKYGYPVETHWIQTEDNYVLKMQRLRYGRNETSADRRNNKPAVLLMHGLLCSAMDFVNMGPGKALALVLAEAGYDVWLGNNRGTTWSRNHVRLNPDIDQEFWEFSFETLGNYDLPAKIDYILKKTGHTKILYVGHSQGTAQFFAMAALRPEYNDKIALMTALAPVAYVQHISSPIFRPLENFFDKIEPVLKKIKMFELLAHSNLVSKIISFLSSDGSPVQEIFAQILFFICGFDHAQLDKSSLPVIFSNLPAGISLQMFSHFSQMTSSGEFRRFDFGEKKNLIIYNSSTPPNFNISSITAPVALYYSENDLLSTVKDVEKLAKQLPNLVNSTLIKYRRFSHLDFLFAKDAKNLLYDELLENLNKYATDEHVTTAIPITTTSSKGNNLSFCFVITVIILLNVVIHQ